MQKYVTAMDSCLNHATRTLTVATLGALGLLLGVTALCALLGLAVLRESPAWAGAVSAALLVTLPMTVIAALVKPKWAGAVTGAVVWPLLLLLGLPVYFPGERGPALAAGMGMLASPGGPQRSAAAARFGEAIDSFLGPELLAGHPPHPMAQPVQPPLVIAALPSKPVIQPLSTDTIALPYEGEGRSLRVPVTFETRDSELEFWMLFDTGATYTTLTTQALHELGLEIPAHAPTASLHTANGVTSAPLVLLDTVWLAGFPVHNVTVAVCDLCGSSSGAGLLGLNVSAQFRVTFDPGERMLELKPQPAGDRTLDLTHWLDIQATASAYPDGRIEVQVRVENLSEVDMALVEVGIACETQSFSALLERIPAGELSQTQVSLPRGTACDPYRISFEGGRWR